MGLPAPSPGRAAEHPEKYTRWGQTPPEILTLPTSGQPRRHINFPRHQLRGGTGVQEPPKQVRVEVGFAGATGATQTLAHLFPRNSLCEPLGKGEGRWGLSCDPETLHEPRLSPSSVCLPPEDRCRARLCTGSRGRPGHVAALGSCAPGAEGANERFIPVPHVQCQTQPCLALLGGVAGK